MFIARARRTRRQYFPGVIAVISMTLMLLASCTGESSPDTATTDVQPSTTQSPALPAGPIALGYVAEGGSYVLLDSGEQYLVPGDLRCCGLASLSPQGRWLLNDDTLYDTGNGSATTVALAAAPRSWSPNGRWMLTHCSSEGTGPRQQLLDTTAGSVVDIAEVPSEEEGSCGAVGVLDDGTVVAAVRPAASASPSREGSLRVLNPQTGDRVREINVDLTSVLRGEEAIWGRLGLHGLLVGPQAELFLRVLGDVNSRTIGVVISADDGSFVRRVDGPDDGWWTPVAFDDQGIVIAHADDGNGVRVSVVTPDGAMHPMHQLPPGAQLMLVPGAAVTM